MARIGRVLRPPHIPLVVRLLFWGAVVLGEGLWVSQQFHDWGPTYHYGLALAAALFALAAIINGQTTRFQSIRAQGHHPFHPLVRVLLWVGALGWIVCHIWSERTGIYPLPGDLHQLATQILLLGLFVNGFLLHLRAPMAETQAEGPTFIPRVNRLRLLPWVGWWLVRAQYHALYVGWCADDCQQVLYGVGVALIILCYLWDWHRALWRRLRRAPKRAAT